MKSFALSLLSATASTTFSDVLSFEFDQYFTRVESRPAKPSLGSYTYGYDYWLPEDWSEYGLSTTASGDINIEYTTPFTNNPERTFYTISFIPEVSLGGEQLFSFYSPYFGLDLSLDLWPGSFQFLATSAQFQPPLFNNFCWWSEWSSSLF